MEYARNMTMYAHTSAKKFEFLMLRLRMMLSFNSVSRVIICRWIKEMKNEKRGTRDRQNRGQTLLI